MIEQIINDVNKALDAEAYLAALSLALILPDICGVAEYGINEQVGKRYKDWYDENIGRYERENSERMNMLPYLSGEVVYSLRCNMIHIGNPNICENKIQDERNRIDRFVLCIEKKKNIELYADSAIKHENKNNANTEYYVNVRRLCYLLCTCAKGYYEKNKDRFTFFNYEILDLNKGYH